MKPFRHALKALLCGAVLLSPMPAVADDFDAALASARTAFEARSFATMVGAARQAEAIRPGHPEALFQLAVGLANDGQIEPALHTLQRIADLGLSHEIDEDPRFAVLRAADGFPALSARLADNGKPQGTAIRLLSHPKRRFIPAGIAHDRDSNTWFLGSAFRREIVIPGEADGHAAFAPPGAHGLFSVLGLFAEPNRRLLWVATTALPMMRGYEAPQAGQSAVIALDLETGRLSRRFRPPEGGAPYRFADITVGRRGDVFVSDELGGRVFSVNRISGRFEALGSPGQLISPQGLAQSRDRKSLFIADAALGLFVHDADSGELHRLAGDPEMCLYGLDGLGLHEGTLIAVQNGFVPHRVIRLHLDESRRRVERLEVLAAADPELQEPTQGVVRGDGFYVIANSGWSRVPHDDRLPPGSEFGRPTILRVPLD